MATCTSMCAVCDLRHQTAPSTRWCIECEEPLCSDCREHHNVLKATKNHKTIPISEYQLLPTVVTDIQQNCVYHNEMYQLYCMKHRSAICNKCVKGHGKCGEILSLEEVVRDVKTSESFVDLQQSIDDLYDNTIQIRKNKESNIKRITDQKKKIIAEVCHLKKQVIQHVNKLEEEFIQELDQIELNCHDTIYSVVFSLQDKEKEINQMKSEMLNMKKYALDLQTFINMSEIQTKTTEYEKHLQSSIENKILEEITIESITNTKIQDILTVFKFGFITVKKRPSSNLDLNRRKDRQAQIIVSKKVKSINDVKFEFKQKEDTTCKYPFGCCVTQKGDFLLTNYQIDNGKCIAINAKGEVEYAIPLTEQNGSFDIVSLNDTTVAVSTGYASEKPGISIVDLTKRKVTKFIDIPSYPYGITYDGKSCICCVKGKNLHLISCTDFSITTIPNTVISRYSYVSTHDDKIFLTNPDKHIITCCLYSGALVWEFKDESIFTSPWGITLDNNGNVFVAGLGSCNVVVISPDGKQCKQILNEEDGIDGPTAIFFDKSRKQILVTNSNQSMHVYNVAYL